MFGPNGAGKTTLLRLLSGAIRPTSGRVEVEGGASARRAGFGLLSHRSFLYDGLTAEENLHFYARLYRLSRARARVRGALAGVGLDARRGELVKRFSRGMRQRLALARTLLHDPGVVLLDEPYTGLDARAASSLRELLGRLRAEQRTVVLVTHNLSQGLELADRVAVMVAGRWLSDESAHGVDPLEFESKYVARLAAAG